MQRRITLSHLILALSFLFFLGLIAATSLVALAIAVFLFPGTLAVLLHLILKDQRYRCRQCARRRWALTERRQRGLVCLLLLPQQQQEEEEEGGEGG